jgi:hypothetical protein
MAVDSERNPIGLQGTLTTSRAVIHQPAWRTGGLASVWDA